LATPVAGGATAIAAKTGLLAKLWKLIVVGFAALAGMLKRCWNSLRKILSGQAAEQTNEQGLAERSRPRAYCSKSEADA